MPDADPMPLPPRFRWLKRLSVAALLLVLLLVGLRLWWGWYEQRKLDAVVNAIAATGEPIRFTDVKMPHVPDADNAAHYYRKALAQWPKIHGQLIIDTKWYNDPKHHADPITDNAAYLKKCAAVFALLNKAAAAPGCNWHVKLTYPVLPPLRQIQDLMHLISDAVQRAHARGDDGIALQLINDELRLSERVGDPFANLTCVSFAIFIRSKVYDDLERITPTLRAPAAASRQQVDAMIARLLNDKQARRAYIQALIGERRVLYHTAKWSIHRVSNFSSIGIQGLPAFLSRCYHPVLVADIRILVQMETHLIAITRAADSWPAYQQNNDIEARIQSVTKHPLLHLSTGLLMPDFRSAARAHFQALTTRRLAATALAIRLYQIDHGKRPATLAQLVPAYLPAVPRDPMAPGHAPLRYLPQGVVPQWPTYSAATQQQRAKLAGKRIAVIYSVGKDGHNNGGKCFYDDDGCVHIWSGNDDPCDAVFVLEPQPWPHR